MQRVSLRFYEELNDFLPEHRKKRTFDVVFELPRSVKDLIESLGVPHVEVDLILVNGDSVGFDHLVGDGDRVSVYPMFEAIDISRCTKLRPVPLRETKFVVDVHLHTLARKLRMLGFDTLWDPEDDDEVLARHSSREERVLLTRDLGLLKRSEVRRGLYVRTKEPNKQLAEILDRLDLYDRIAPLSRCIRCNAMIDRLEPGEDSDVLIERVVPPGVRRWCREYFRCAGCGRVYWRGSHFDRMLEEVKHIRSAHIAKPPL